MVNKHIGKITTTSLKNPYGCPEGKRVWGFYLEKIHACFTKEDEKMY